MIEVDKILSYLRSRWEAGETQQQIANSTGISRSYLCEILSGKAGVDRITVGTINKLFPKATLQLEGDAVSITAPKNRGNVVGVNHGSMASDCLSGVMDKILATEELTAEEKVKVLKVLKK